MTDVNTLARPQNIVRGVVLILATVFVISIQDVIFKLFSSALPLWQIFSVRALLAFPLLFAVAWWQGLHRVVLRDALRVWSMVRAFCLTMTFMAYYAAIAFLSLSVVGAANYTAPIIVTVLSAFLIGEAVGVLGWIAVVVGFVGVVVLLQPGTDAFSLWAVLPLIGACFYALAHITTRAKCQPVPLVTLAMSVNISMLIAGLVMSTILLVVQPDETLVRAYPNVLGGWSEIDPIEWLVLVLLATFVVVLALMLAGAYQAAPPAIIATFEYGYLVFVAIWDFVFFAAAPTGTTLFGMAMIIAAGLMVLRRG